MSTLYLFLLSLAAVLRCCAAAAALAAVMPWCCAVVCSAVVLRYATGVLLAVVAVAAGWQDLGQMGKKMDWGMV